MGAAGSGVMGHLPSTHSHTSIPSVLEGPIEGPPLPAAPAAPVSVAAPPCSSQGSLGIWSPGRGSDSRGPLLDSAANVGPRACPGGASAGAVVTRDT